MRDAESFLIKQALQKRAFWGALRGAWGAWRAARGARAAGTAANMARTAGTAANTARTAGTAAKATGAAAPAAGGGFDTWLNRLGSLAMVGSFVPMAGELLGGGQQQQPRMPGEGGYPGAQGYPGSQGYPRAQGYTPFSSHGMESVTRTPRYRMGARPMYSQQPFMHWGSAERDGEQQLAFDHGVDLFCKQAGFDEEDQAAMHVLLKTSDYASDLAQADAQRRSNWNWLNPWSQEWARATGRGLKQLHSSTGIDLSGFGAQEEASYQTYLRNLPRGKQPLSKNEFKQMQGAPAAAPTAAPAAPAGGVPPRASPAFQSGSVNPFTGGTTPGAGRWGHQGRAYWNQLQSGKVTPGGTAGQQQPKSVDEMLASTRAALAKRQGQASKFEEMGQVGAKGRMQEAINQINMRGLTDPRDQARAIRYAARGNYGLRSALEKHYGIGGPAGPRATQTGGTRYDPSGGTRAPRSAPSPGVQGAGIPQAPEGATQVPGGWAVRSDTAGIPSSDTARRDLQRRMGTNAFFRLRGEAPGAQPSTVGLAERAGFTGGQTPPSFQGSFEQFMAKRQEPNPANFPETPEPSDLPAPGTAAAVDRARYGKGTASLFPALPEKPNPALASKPKPKERPLAIGT